MSPSKPLLHSTQFPILMFNTMAINYNTLYSSPFSEISSVRGALRKICRCWSRLQRNYYPSSGMIHWQVRWIYWCTLLSNKFKCYPFSQVQSKLVIRNFLVTLKLFLNAKCFLSLWSKLAFGHRKWFLNTNLFLSKCSLSPRLTVLFFSIPSFTFTYSYVDF